MLLFGTYEDAVKVKEFISDVLLGEDNVYSVSTRKIMNTRNEIFYSVRIGVLHEVSSKQIAHFTVRLQKATVEKNVALNIALSHDMFEQQGAIYAA